MKILFDTDIGSDIDDALALLMLLHLSNIELLGTTTVYGVVDIRAKVARRILDAAGVNGPIATGESQPIYSTIPVWHAGTEGDGVLTPEDLAAPITNLGVCSGAAEFIIDTIDTHPGEVTLVSLGALTNVARAVRRRPDIAGKLKRFYFMGGGVTFQNSMPERLVEGESYRADPSHNIRCDVGAAQLVFDSPLSIHLLTNDVTTQLWWDGEPVCSLRGAKHPPENRLVGRLLDVWLQYRTDIFKMPVTGTCLHDPLTVAEATGHSFVSYAAGNMTVNNDGSTDFVPDAGGRHFAGVDFGKDEFLPWFTEHVFQREAGCLAR